MTAEVTCHLSPYARRAYGCLPEVNSIGREYRTTLPALLRFLVWRTGWVNDGSKERPKDGSAAAAGGSAWTCGMGAAHAPNQLRAAIRLQSRRLRDREPAERGGHWRFDRR